MRIRTFPLFVFALLIFLNTSNAYSIDNTMAQQIITKFQSQATSYGAALKNYAERLFYWCLVLDVVLLGINCTLGRAQIADAIKQFCMILLFTGFIFAVIHNYQTWTGNIINGLQNIGLSLTNQSVSLSPFSTAMDIATMIIKKISIGSPLMSAVYLIIGGTIIFCFGLMAAHIVLIKVSSYLALNAAVILLGFGACGFLKEYAINTLRYVLSVALKLFVLQLVLGIGMQFITELQSIQDPPYEVLFLMLIESIILLALVKTLPDEVGGLISGSHSGSGAGLATTAAEVGAAAIAAPSLGAAAAGSVGSGIASASRGTMSVIDAANIANQDGHPGLRGTARVLWDSSKAARQTKNSMGSVGQRMSSNLKETLAVRKAAKGDSESSE